MWGDTATIRALAGRLRERADEVRDLAARLSAAAREVAWQGVAADAMRRHVEGRVVALLRTARLHEDAAEALEQHAARVDAALDLLTLPLHVVEELR
ncbi:hypothetical protein [Nocardioides sp.]|uniref:hypothetical protein n=1 Tax=Nocardioides sp. TaxID=35761 RepID=UPI003783FB53